MDGAWLSLMHAWQHPLLTSAMSAVTWLGSLAVLLPLWYWAARWLAMPVIWLAGTVMQALFPWVDGWAQEGVSAVLHTLVQVRMPGAPYVFTGKLTPKGRDVHLILSGAGAPEENRLYRRA